MAQTVRLAKGKRRYTITLTESNAERIKTFIKENNGSVNQFSMMIDDCVNGLANGLIPYLEKIVKETGRPLRDSDMIRYMGNAMADQMEQVKLL